MTSADPGDKAARTSLGELLSEVSKDISTLFRQEVALAKAEASASAKKAGKGAGMLGGATVAAYLAILFLSIAVWWGLGELIGRGWSGLVVALVWGVIALVLALQSKKELQAIKGTPQTAETLKEIPKTFK